MHMYACMFMCSCVVSPNAVGPKANGREHNMMHHPWPDAAIAPGGTTSFKLVDGYGAYGKAQQLTVWADCEVCWG